jgi:PAS domain S-box-containing protein
MNLAMVSSRPNLLRLLWISLPFVLSVAIAITLLIYSSLWIKERHHNDVVDAQHNARVLADVLTEHVQRSFEQADVLAKLIGERIAKEGFDVDLNAMARAGTISLDVFVQVAATDEKGILRASTVRDFKPIDLSDRAHIRVHMKDPSHGPFVSKPLVGRASGKWSIQYSRAIIAGDGQFKGVVVVSLDPTYFSGFYDQVDIGQSGVIALIGTDDRTVRTRRTGKNYTAGQEVPADSPLLQNLKISSRGSYTAESAIDHRMRYYGYASLSKYPFAIVVGLDRDEYLAGLKAKRANINAWVYAVAAFLVLLGAVGSLGFRKVFREAQAKSHARDQARELAEQLSTVIEAAPDGFVIVDARKHVSGCNDAFATMSGLNDEQTKGKPLQEVLDRWSEQRQFDTDFDADQLFNALTTDTRRCDEVQRVVISRRRPPQQVVELRARRLSADTPGFILIARDITHETEIDRMKSEFIATAAHELRTPMASIKGFAELLSNDKVPEQKRGEMLAIILRQANRMAELLNDLLDLARIEARSDLDFRYEQIDLRDLVNAVADEFGYLSGRMLLREIPAAPVLVKADRAKLSQAMRNLLSNAFKFSEAPAPVTLRIEAAPADQRATIEVRDQGMGITDDQQRHLFQRFYRADKSGRIQGSGLGLSLVKIIVELHSGRVKIDSKFGVGTKACIHLPLVAAAAPHAHASTTLQET